MPPSGQVLRMGSRRGPTTSDACSAVRGASEGWIVPPRVPAATAARQSEHLSRSRCALRAGRPPPPCRGEACCCGSTSQARPCSGARPLPISPSMRVGRHGGRNDIGAVFRASRSGSPSPCRPRAGLPGSDLPPCTERRGALFSITAPIGNMSAYVRHAAPGAKVSCALRADCCGPDRRDLDREAPRSIHLPSIAQGCVSPRKMSLPSVYWRERTGHDQAPRAFSASSSAPVIPALSPSEGATIRWSAAPGK